MTAPVARASVRGGRADRTNTTDLPFGFCARPHSHEACTQVKINILKKYLNYRRNVGPNVKRNQHQPVKTADAFFLFLILITLMIILNLVLFVFPRIFSKIIIRDVFLLT